MTIRESSNADPVQGAQTAPRTGLRPWLKLFIGIVMVLLFMFGFGTLSQYIPGARHMANVIDERDIRATAIYYTDFKEPAESSEYIRDCLEYTPGKVQDQER